MHSNMLSIIDQNGLPTSAVKPTLLVVHGAWHSPAHMEPMASILRSKGYEVHCPLLPTMGDNTSSDYKHKTFYDDVRLIRDELQQILARDRDVVVVAHSYGGQVTSEAVHESLSKSMRTKQSKVGGVIGLFYISAFLVPEGTIGISWFLLPQFAPPRFIHPHPFMGYNTAHDSANHFYNDLLPDEQKKWQAELRPSTLTGWAKPTTYAAQRYFPTTYLRCSKDKTIVPSLQQYMLNRNREAGIKAIREVECEAGHSPFLSMPGRVVDEILAATELYSNPVK